MPEIQTDLQFYTPWPKFGKRLNFQWGELRQDIATLKAIARAQVQDVETGDDFVNADRVLAGLEFGELVSNTESFKNQFRLFYDKDEDKFCIQRNTGTEANPVWVDFLCIDQDTGMVTVIGLDAGALGVGSEGGFYGLPDQRMQRIGEIGGTADTVFSPPNTDALWFNTNDFYLTARKGGPFAGTPVVNAKNSFGLSRVFEATGVEWIINHNFGISPVMVQVFDSNDRAIIPGEADVSDPNTAFFYFDSTFTGRVIISTGGLGAAELVPLDPFYLLVRASDRADVPRFNNFADIVFDKDDFYVGYREDQHQARIRLGDSFANLSNRVDSLETTTGSGFYGITVKHSDDTESFSGINVITFNADDFYLTQNSPNTDEVIVNFRGSAGSGGGGGGLSSITVKETDGTPPDYATDTLTFDSADFYLTTDSAGKPIVSLRGSEELSSTATHVHVQGSAAVEWVVTHNLNTKNLVVQTFNNDDRVVQFDEADTSDPNIAYFYFVSGQAGKAIVISGQGNISTTGEANTASNLGAGEGVFAQKVGVDLQFKSLIAGTGITLTPSSTDITIASTGGGGGGGGFYGIYVRESDGNPPTFQNDTLIFNSPYFYLSPNSVGKPTVSIREDNLLVGHVNDFDLHKHVSGFYVIRDTDGFIDRINWKNGDFNIVTRDGGNYITSILGKHYLKTIFRDSDNRIIEVNYTPV